MDRTRSIPNIRFTANFVGQVAVQTNAYLKAQLVIQWLTLPNSLDFFSGEWRWNSCQYIFSFNDNHGENAWRMVAGEQRLSSFKVSLLLPLSLPPFPSLSLLLAPFSELLPWIQLAEESVGIRSFKATSRQSLEFSDPYYRLVHRQICGRFDIMRD